MTHWSNWSCAAGIALALSAQPTHAQTPGTQAAVGTAQVTFSVPVQVQGFSTDVSQLQVYCQASSNTGGPQTKGYLNAPMSGGAYSGTVNVPVTFSVTQPGASWGYRCNLTFFNSKLNQWGIGVESWDKALAGTTPQIATTGNVVVGSPPPTTRPIADVQKAH